MSSRTSPRSYSHVGLGTHPFQTSIASYKTKEAAALAYDKGREDVLREVCSIELSIVISGC